jgi:hypothetical protein
MSRASAFLWLIALGFSRSEARAASTSRKVEENHAQRNDALPSTCIESTAIWPQSHWCSQQAAHRVAMAWRDSIACGVWQQVQVAREKVMLLPTKAGPARQFAHVGRITYRDIGIITGNNPVVSRWAAVRIADTGKQLTWKNL